MFDFRLVSSVTPDLLERSKEWGHTGGMSTSPTLQDLHDRYVAAINIAVSEDDLTRVDELSADYENEALELLSSAA